MFPSRLTRGPGVRRERVRRFLPALVLVLLACGLIPGPAPTPTPLPTVTPTPLPTALPSTNELGSRRNPLILALAPSSQPTTNEVLDAGNSLVGMLEKATGYHMVSVIPPTETDLVQGFANGSAHVGVLTPFGYLIASEQGTAEVAFAREHGKDIFYGAQFLARSDSGFTAYFDPVKDGNMAQAPEALAQFQDKKPCWTDELSPSGYVVPLGYLNQNHINIREPAFLAGHVAVVRAIAAGGICDFGATYIDARTYPGLEDQYPDLLKQVVVIWRIPPIIPYETLVFARSLDEEMHRNLLRAFVDIEATPEGKSALQLLYGFDSMRVAQDSDYDPFRKLAQASNLDLSKLIK